ncbi:hypothetical protein HPP92_001519 [Vanilla planifolia]|uniref:Transcription initiation factor IIF subunit alpha n=1 Tax=Vanilla planifolia TaxID=51239 RepID=A0A835SC36_VANPL|nr:hypothetical protein HPP92_001519 [Vanilla planifolia]
MDDESTMSPVLAPKLKDAPKEEPADNSPLKPSGSARGTPSSKASKSKKKTGVDDGKSASNTPVKKEIKPSVKEEKVSSTSKASPPVAARTGPALAPTSSPVTEEEIRAVLLAMAPVTTQELVAKFKGRIKSKEDKDAFAAILRRISKIQKTNGQNYVVLK